MSPRSAPAISVVIPCRNEAKRLHTCLDALLAQDFPTERYELIVVDGRSVDGCREIARAHGARVLRDSGGGPAAARNVGVRAARGEIVAFTDADCVPNNDWLTRLAEVFSEDPTIAGVAGALRLPRGTLLGRMEDNDAQLYYRGFITSNIAYTRDALVSVGGFNEQLDCAEDYDLAWRLLDLGYRIVNDPRPRVLHDDPELKGPVRGYLRKQAWYARHDVPAHVIALRRGLRPHGGLAAGSAQALAGGASALLNATWTAALVGGLVSGATAVTAAGIAGAALSGGRKVLAGARQLGDIDAQLPAMALLNTAKCFARGAGTLAGLADLARPSMRARLRQREAVALAPAPPRAVVAARARA